jgi:maltose alpha-D-glucosyltransferase / alpha-amylase
MAIETPNLAMTADGVTPGHSTQDEDPLWYKDAIIYQAHVKAFFDSTNDGIGDFAGPTSARSCTRRTIAGSRC